MDRHRQPISWSPEARADLAGIWDYYREVAGLNTAERISREVNRTCNILSDHPFVGRSRSEIRAGLRSLVANPHVIFYRVTDHDAPEIVRIVDERQDIDATFSAQGVEHVFPN
jgi:toxin ParE1/3/4